MRIISTTILATFALLSLSCEPSLSSERVSDEQRAEIASIMQAMADNGQYSGTVLVAVDGEPVYTGAFGQADIERGVPNTLDTQFRIASATKPFTALLIYQLVDSGKLSLDDRLSDLLPGYPAEKGANVTVSHLLTHSWGSPVRGAFQSLAILSATAGPLRNC